MRRVLTHFDLAYTQDLAIGQVLRTYDPKVEAMFGDMSPALRAMHSEVEKRESDILETARLDFTWAARYVNRFFPLFLMLTLT